MSKNEPAELPEGMLNALVRFISSNTVYVPTVGRLYTQAVDAAGRIWERYDDEPRGVWHLIDAPEEPSSDPPAGP